MNDTVVVKLLFHALMIINNEMGANYTSVKGHADHALWKPSLQIGLLDTADRLTLWPKRSLMLSILFKIIVGLRIITKLIADATAV